jgi:hypothetical protein
LQKTLHSFLILDNVFLHYQMLSYYRSVQRPRKSYHVNLPKPLIDILDLKKNQIVNISLASDKGEKVVLIRALHEPTKEEATTTETVIS